MTTVSGIVTSFVWEGSLDFLLSLKSLHIRKTCTTQTVNCDCDEFGVLTLCFPTKRHTVSSDEIMRVIVSVKNVLNSDDT